MNVRAETADPVLKKIGKKSENGRNRMQNYVDKMKTND